MTSAYSWLSLPDRGFAAARHTDWPRSLIHDSSPNAVDPGELIEPGIEAEDFTDSAFAHDCKLECVAGREALVPEQDFLRAFNRLEIHREHFIDNPEDCIERGLNCVSGTAAQESGPAIVEIFHILCVRNIIT